MKPPELLAPAGTFECLRAGCDHGADAVYVGIGHFNLRARSGNFSIEELNNAITYVKQNDRKIYAALNIMPGDGVLDQIEDLVKSLSAMDALPDALIVSDPGVITLCRRYLGSVPLHLSTQTGTCNYLSARFWQQQGITRIVLPREMTLSQVSAFNRKAALETELFVHGAMCVSISGRCLLGAYLGGRHGHANQGDCPQPCRLKYRIVPLEGDEKHDGEGVTIEEFPATNGQAGEAYLLNSKDLNTLPLLPRIIETGVSALKIEGRNKGPHYVASVVKVYREALDLCLEKPTEYSVKPQWAEELDRLDHRTYTTGFYGSEDNLQEVHFSQTKAGLRIVGSVKGVLTSGEAVIDVKNPFTIEDTFNVLPVKKGEASYELRLIALTDMNGNPIDRAITHRVVIAQCGSRLRIGDMLRSAYRAAGEPKTRTPC
jgi:Collagenase and related proteases